MDFWWIPQKKEHVKFCEAKKSKYNNCQKDGALWRSTKVSELEIEYLEQEIQQIHTHSDYDVDIFNIDLLKINVSNTSTNNLKDFKTQVIKNNHLDTVLVDTGAKVSAWIATQSTKRGFTEKMLLFNSPPMSVKVLSWCTVTHGQSPVPVEWYLIEGTCESALSGAWQNSLTLFTSHQQKMFSNQLTWSLVRTKTNYNKY